MSVRLALIAAIVLLLAPAAHAQKDDKRAEPAAGVAQSDGEDKTFSVMLDTRLGFGMIDEDFFLTVNLGAVFRWWKLGVAVQAPLRFRIVDQDPKTDGVFRREDWDEPSDWTRVVRFIEWGAPGEEVYARLGVLTGTTFGHGTLVDRYFNVIDADHFQTGVQVDLDFGVAGGQTFFDNLLDPQIWGLRGFIRPFHLWDDAPDLAKRVTLGVNFVGDFLAPLRARLDGANNRIVDEQNNLAVEHEPAILVGFDLGWETQPAEWIAITPFTDLNVLTNTGGLAYHLGIMGMFNIVDVVKLGFRVEYRAISGDMMPGYVNSWYELERVDYQNNTPTLGFLKQADSRGEDGIRHGWHASMQMTILEAFTIVGIFEDFQGPNNSNLMLQLMLPYIAGVRLSAYYAKRNFDNAKEAFDLDRGMLVAELKWKFWGPMYAWAQYSREWRLERDRASADYGQYHTINDWDLGIGAEFTF